MMKKIIFFMFLGLFIFFATDKVLADESTTQIKWYKADGKLERLSATRNSGKSVCTVMENIPDSYDFCSARFFYFQTDAVLTYLGEGKWQSNRCSNGNGVCVNNGSINDKNGTADCVYNSNELPSCTNFGSGKKISVGSWGCASINTYGRCNHEGKFICQQPCSDQGECNSETRNLGSSVEPKYYSCLNKNCPKERLLNGMAKCESKNEISKIKVECNDGKIKRTTCPNNQQCFSFRDGEAQCHSVYDDVCVKLPNGQSVGPYLQTFVGCKNNQIIKCVTPPTIELGEDCSLTKKECFPFPDKNEAECKSETEINEYNSLLSITTYSTQEFFCSGNDQIKTAIGCIPITINKLADKLLPTIFGIAGGIAFLMMVYGFITISTSSGDEKKVQAAKQIVTSAIIGLLVSLFALFLYRLIAVDILHIPGI